jgi:hypothetical protein
MDIVFLGAEWGFAKTINKYLWMLPAYMVIQHGNSTNIIGYFINDAVFGIIENIICKQYSYGRKRSFRITSFSE